MTSEAKLIFKQVCKTLNIPEEKALAKSNLRVLAEARFICVYFIKSNCPHISLRTIGTWFKRADNGAANSFSIYGMRQTILLRETNAEFKRKYLLCLNALSFHNKEINFNNISQY
jgi:hypothetical protein